MSQTVTLASPQQDNFEAFIIGNAAQYVTEPYQTRGELLAHIGRNVLAGTPSMVQENSHVGETLVICGAGPSLKDEAKEHCADAKHLWGCNSALTWLIEQGYSPTAGFAIDQGAAMLSEWITTPDVEYMIATTTHPHLTQLLRSRNRRVTYFHNFVGVKKPPVSWPDENGDVQSADYESWMYCLLYPSCVRSGTGLNSVTRAIDVALYMGFEKIIVLGADCALRAKKKQPNAPLGSARHMRWLSRDVQMHADGSTALRSGATPITFSGKIDGRLWVTKPDMMISALSIVALKKRLGGRLVLVGDTLPNALKDKPEDFLSQMPQLNDSSGEAIRLA